MESAAVTPSSLLHTLKNANVFATLSLADLQSVVGVSQVTTYCGNQFVFKANSVPTDIAVVISGGMHVVDVLEDGRLCHVGTVITGGSVGWISAIDLLPISSHVVAASPGTEVLHVPIKAIQSLFAQRPAFSQAVLGVLASTIRHYMRSRAALSAPNVAQRLYRVLLGLAQNPTLPNGVLPKQQDLATLANTSRETVSRTLQELIKHGILDKKGHQITVKNIAALQRLANGQAA